MSTNQLRSFSKLSLTPTSKAVNPIARPAHHMSTSTKPTPARSNSDVAPLHPRLPIPKTLTSLLRPKLSFRGMASGPAHLGSGPILARVMSDPTFHKEADTEAKVAIEKAVAEEMLQRYFPGPLGKVVRKGPLPATPADTAPREHTALWHVLNEDDGLWVVYAYAHAGGETEDGLNMYMLRLRQVIGEEIKEAEMGGRRRGGKVFGIAQAGMEVSFFQYGRGDLGDAGLGGV